MDMFNDLNTDNSLIDFSNFDNSFRSKLCICQIVKMIF